MVKHYFLKEYTYNIILYYFYYRIFNKLNIAIFNYISKSLKKLYYHHYKGLVSCFLC